MSCSPPALHCSSHQLNLCPDHAFLCSQSRDQTIKYFQLNQRSQDLWKYLNSNNGWWYRCIVNHLIQDLKYKTVLISIDFESINLAQVEPALSFVSAVFVLFYSSNSLSTVNHCTPLIMDPSHCHYSIVIRALHMGWDQAGYQHVIVFIPYKYVLMAILQTMKNWALFYACNLGTLIVNHIIVRSFFIKWEV